MSGYLSEEVRSFPARRSSPATLSAVSPKRRFGKLGRKTSDGSQQSGSSAESTVTRQPCKSRLRNHSNRLSGVFLRGPSSSSGSMASNIKTSLSITTRKASTISTCTIAEDPSELSNHVTAPGVLKIFGSEICRGAHYKSVLATTQSSAKELVKEALERYGLSKEEAGSYVLCDAIGSICENQWKTEACRVVGDNEKPLLLQSLWKPREGLARRFEIQKRSSVEERALQEKDTVTAGINAQARKLQKSRSRVTSTLMERSSGRGALWRSKSSTDMLDSQTHQSPTHQNPRHQSQTSLQIYELPTTGEEHSHSEAGDSAGRTEALCEPGARGERGAVEWEREETESSGDSSTQYSIHPPQDCPYLLLLRGHSHAQDFLIYLLASPNVTVGRISDPNQEPKVDIVLSADDILMTHCSFHRHQNGCPITLSPCPIAVVTRNGEQLSAEVTLGSGDVIGIGHRYLFMFKDPAIPSHPVSQLDFFTAEPWLLTHMPTSPDELILCSTCISTFPCPPPCLKTPHGHDLTICFPTHSLDTVTKEIVTMGLHGTDSTDKPLMTLAFLISTCIQYCATSLRASQLRRLLLLTASHLQSHVWVSRGNGSKEDLGIDKKILDTEESNPLDPEAVISGLRPLVVWMSNSLELMHFIQFQLPELLEWRSRKEQGHAESTQHNLVLQIYLSCVRSAMEETIAVLEQVVMLAFQQCVYYITKVLYPLLPDVLDCNPFRRSPDTPDPTDGSPVLGSPPLRAPEEVQKVVEVLNQTWRLLQTCQLHPEISAQLVGYLFYFINASLFNSLMERGSEEGFYQWSRGVHLRASLDLILDWAQERGLGELALEQTIKLSGALNLLATPRKTLLKTCWSSLRSLYPSLHPAQLHHLLSLYRPLSHPRSTWSPSAPDQDAALDTGDILESFDTQHPLVLPDGGYHFYLETPVTESGLWGQLEELSLFICNTCETSEEQAPPKSHLQTTSSTPPPTPASSPAANYNYNSCGAQRLAQKLQHLELQNQQRDEDRDATTQAAVGSSPSLLTPPTSPRSPRDGHHIDRSQQLKNNETDLWISNGDIHKEGVSVCEDLTELKTVVELQEEEEEDHENNNQEVFSLELQRGERGIGLALVDTWDAPVKTSGLFISAVLPDSPAARTERLAPGDRILAVNGVSLLGVD
ncbi:hypothetical protein NQD34_014550, partial [Periophthalmus magnuspinnatus]